MTNFIFNGRSYAKVKFQAACIWLLAVIAITVMAFTSCTKKSTQTEGLTQQQTYYADEHEGGPGDDYEALPPGFGYPYTAILDGDLSEFAGTWVNGRGDRYPLRADGVFDGGLNAYEFTRGADKNSPYITNGTNYEWLVNMGEEAGVFEIWLFPAGVDIKNRSGEIIKTDKTKDRIVFEYITTSDGVYYLAGETASLSLTQEPAELTGEWHSRSITGSCHGQEHYIFTADGYYRKGDLYQKHDGIWTLVRDAATGKYHLTLQYKQFIDFESGWSLNEFIENSEYETIDPNNIDLLIHGTGWIELTRCNNPGWNAQ
ncbi:MAG: hypothetical protein FWB86_14730 [Treponema sp.]|nr:hypothetical protein [Treponema sp.]